MSDRCKKCNKLLEQDLYCNDCKTTNNRTAILDLIEKAHIEGQRKSGYPNQIDAKKYSEDVLSRVDL